MQMTQLPSIQNNLRELVISGLHSQDKQVTIFNQLWLDRVPEAEKDKFNLFAILRKEKFGVFQTASQFEGDFSLFSLESSDDKTVSVKMLQTDKKSKISWSAKPSSGKEIGDFTLTISGQPRGPSKYFTLEDWEIENLASLDALMSYVNEIRKNTKYMHDLFNNTHLC